MADSDFIAGLVKSGTLLQCIATQSGAATSGTTLLPLDNTIPQNTEGNAAPLDTTITPKSATSKLKISVTVHVEHSVATSNICAALFQDANANALACAATSTAQSGIQPPTISFTHYMTAGTTAATTFKVRFGSSVAGTAYFNSNSTGQIYGGVLASSVVVEEISA